MYSSALYLSDRLYINQLFQEILKIEKTMKSKIGTESIQPKELKRIKKVCSLLARFASSRSTILS